MKIDFEVNIEEHNEHRILDYFSMFAKVIMLSEGKPIVNLKINDIPVEDSGICIY